MGERNLRNSVCVATLNGDERSYPREVSSWTNGVGAHGCNEWLQLQFRGKSLAVLWENVAPNFTVVKVSARKFAIYICLRRVSLISITCKKKKKNSTLYFPVTFAKYIYDARAQVITFARLRFVRFAMDSCQSFGRINIIVKFDFSLVFFFLPVSLSHSRSS